MVYLACIGLKADGLTSSAGTDVAAPPVPAFRLQRIGVTKERGFYKMCVLDLFL